MAVCVTKRRSGAAPCQWRLRHWPLDDLLKQTHRPRSVTQLVKELGGAVLLDVSDGLLVDAGPAAVGAHQLPRPFQDIFAVDLVIERLEPASGIGFGRPIERSLALTNPSLCINA